MVTRLAYIGVAILLILIGGAVYFLTSPAQSTTIRVVDEEGRPVGGAKVLLNGEIVGETAPDGTVTIEGADGGTITIAAQGYEKVILRAGDVPSTVVLKPLVVTGKIVVTDFERKPVEARLRIFGENGVKELVGSKVELKMSLVPTDDAVVVGEGKTLRVEAEANGYQKAVGTLRFEAPYLILRLKRRAPPTATVTVLTAPAVNGRAYIRKGSQKIAEAIVKGGKAVFRGVPYGRYTLAIVPEIGNVPVEVNGNTFDLTVDRKSVTKKVHVALPKASEVEPTRIKVVDARTGDPVDASVFVHETNTSYEVKGSLVLKLKKGTSITVTASAKGHKSATATVSAGSEYTIELEPAAMGALRVTTTDIHGTPIDGASVAVLDENGAVLAETLTDERGHATFEDMAQGEYTVRACSGPVCADKNVVVESERTADVTITIPPGYASIALRVTRGGAPATGTANACWGDECASCSLDIAGTCSDLRVPAYVAIRLEIHLGDLTWVVPDLKLFPDENREVNIDVPASLPEDMPALQVVDGPRFAHPGEDHVIRFLYVGKKEFSYTIRAENAVFTDTDWPGEYSIGDENGSAEQGHELRIRTACKTPCGGEFSAKLKVSKGIQLGKIRIEWDGGAYTIPIVPGRCSDENVCAVLEVLKDGERVSPDALREETPYDFVVHVLWIGDPLSQARAVVEAEGNAEITSGSPVSLLDGKASITGTIYAEDPGDANMVIQIEECADTCRNVGSVKIPMIFQPENAVELQLLPTPGLIVRGCPTTLTLKFLDANGYETRVDTEKVVVTVAGRRNGDLVELPWTWRSKGREIAIDTDGADYNAIVVHVDGFGYAGTEVNIPVITDPVHISPEENEGPILVSEGGEIRFSVLPAVPGITVRILEADIDVPGATTSSNAPLRVPDENELILFVEQLEAAYGQRGQANLRVRYAVNTEGHECRLERNATFNYIITPNCIDFNAEWMENAWPPTLAIRAKNTCENITPRYVSTSIEDPLFSYSCTGDSNAPLAGGAYREWRCKMDVDKHSGIVYAQPTVRVVAGYEIGDQVVEEEHVRKLPKIPVIRGLATFVPADAIDPADCTDLPEDRGGIFVGTLTWEGTEEGIAFAPEEIKIGGARIPRENVALVSVDNPEDVKIGEPLEPSESGEYLVYILAQGEWYFPFPLEGTGVENNVELKGCYTTTGSCDTAPVQTIGAAKSKLLPIRYNVDTSGTFINESCGPVELASGDAIIAAPPREPVDLALLVSLAMEGETASGLERLCRSPDQYMPAVFYGGLRRKIPIPEGAPLSKYVEGTKPFVGFLETIRAGDASIQENCSEGPCIRAVEDGIEISVQHGGTKCQLYIYEGANWSGKGSNEVKLTGTPYKALSEFVRTCSKSTEGHIESEYPVEFRYNSQGQCEAQQVQQVQQLNSSAEHWGVGGTACPGGDALGMTRWSRGGTPETLPEWGIVNPKEGVIPGYVVSMLKLVPGIHLQWEGNIEGEQWQAVDVWADFDTETNSPICHGGAKAYIAFYSSAGCIEKASSSEANLVILCVPDCKGCYDTNILNNVLVVDKIVPGDVNTPISLQTSSCGPIGERVLLEVDQNELCAVRQACENGSWTTVKRACVRPVGKT